MSADGWVASKRGASQVFPEQAYGQKTRIGRGTPCAPLVGNLCVQVGFARLSVSALSRFSHQSASGLSRCSPDGRSANFSRCSGRRGSEMACSALNHLPRSTSLQRSEQNGPNLPASQSPDILQVGHLVCRPRLFGFGCNRLEIAEHLCTVLHGHAAVRQNLFHAVQNHLLLRR